MGDLGDSGTFGGLSKSQTYFTKYLIKLYMKVPHNFREVKRPRPTAPFNKVSHTHPGGGHPLRSLQGRPLKKIKPRKRKM